MTARKTLYLVVGPTAIGKTAFAIKLAKALETEILSVDSRQFYKEMSIGTAVPDASELSEIRHHFIQHKSIFDTYTVGDFEREAICKLEELFNRYNSVVAVGGSGLYVSALVNGLDSFPEVEETVRKSIREIYLNDGLSALQRMLEERDLDYFKSVDRQNPQRILRALEVSISSGTPYSVWLGKQKTKRPFEIKTIGLTTDRAIVYERINARVDAMVAKGLIDEAKSLFVHKNLNALNTVGYKELFDYFDGNLSIENALEAIKMNTRRFAKRQMTYFNNKLEVDWIQATSNTNIDALI